MTENRPEAVKARTGAIIFTVYGFFALAGILALALACHLPVLAVISAALTLIWCAGYLWASASLDRLGAQEVLSVPHSFPGEEVALQLTLSNRKWLPLAWVKIEKQGTPLLENIDSPYLTVPEGGQNCRLGWLAWFQEARWDYRIIPRRRGLYQIGPMTLTSGDPFGLFTRSRTIPGGPRLLVYPPLLEAGLAIPLWPDPLGEKQARDFLYPDPLALAGVREYSPGDTLRRINWVATAKTQKLLVNLLEGSVGTRVVLAIGDPEPNQPIQMDKWEEYSFELLTAAAASLALALARQRLEVGLLSAYAPVDSPHQATWLPPGAGKELEIITLLALISPRPIRDFNAFLSENPLPPRARLVILTRCYNENNFRQWQNIARGRPITCLVLEDKGEKLPAGVYTLFPGWQQDRELARMVMGPLWEVE